MRQTFVLYRHFKKSVEVNVTINISAASRIFLINSFYIHKTDKMSGLAQSVEVDLTERFWMFIEKSMGCVVPMYVKHILHIRGYDNAVTVGSLTAADLKQIQEFVKNKLERTPPENIDKRKFYHQYHEKSDPFEILPGHVKLIEKIISFIKSMPEIHGPGYFGPHSEKNVRKPDYKRNPLNPRKVLGLYVIHKI